LGEPRLVPELEGGPHVGWDELEEARQARDVLPELRRELEQDRAEALAHRAVDVEREGEIRGAVLQALDVREALARLDDEAEVAARLRLPALDHAGLRRAVEGVVDLDRGEARRVVGEALLRRQVLGVER